MRKCWLCGAVLSNYNPGSLCRPCQTGREEIFYPQWALALMDAHPDCNPRALAEASLPSHEWIGDRWKLRTAVVKRFKSVSRAADVAAIPNLREMLSGERPITRDCIRALSRAGVR